MTTNTRRMSAPNFVNTVLNKGGFIPAQFIAKHSVRIQEWCNQYPSLTPIVESFINKKLLPSQFLQTFAKALDSFVIEENAKKAEESIKRNQDNLQKRQDKIDNGINVSVLIRVFDSKGNPTDNFETYIHYKDKDDTEGTVWSKTFSPDEYNEAFKWLMNKLHTINTPNAKGILTDNRFNREETYTPQNGTYAKEHKLGHSTAFKTSRKRTDDDTDRKPSRIPNQVMRVKG